MTEESAFIQAILEAPNDWGARLAFADWLEERCDPRAEYYRLEHRLWELPLGAPELQATLNRQTELLVAHWAQLKPTVRNRCKLLRKSWRYREVLLWGRALAIIECDGSGLSDQVRVNGERPTFSRESETMNPRVRCSDFHLNGIEGQLPVKVYMHNEGNREHALIAVDLEELYNDFPPDYFRR